MVDSLYARILDALDKIRDLQREEAKTDQNKLLELRTTAKMTGLIFDCLILKGYPMYLSEKPGFYMVNIEDHIYECHKNMISERTEPLPASAMPVRNMTENKPAEVSVRMPEPDDRPKNIQTGSSEREYPAEPQRYDDFGDGLGVAEPSQAAVQSIDEPPAGKNPLSYNPPYPDPGDKRDEGSFDDGMSFEESNDLSANIIRQTEMMYADEPSDVRPMALSDYDDLPGPQAFIKTEPTIAEEQTILVSDLVYDTFQLTVGIKNSPTRPESVYAMIAPLEMSNGEDVNAPIIVAMYYKGGFYIESSHSRNINRGQKLVTIEVGEHQFLCRGVFNEHGEFTSYIQTAGNSAAQNEFIQLINHKHYGQGKVGHLRYRRDIEDVEHIIDVFPIDMTAGDYAIMVRCPEFTDYYTISPKHHLKARLNDTNHFGQYEVVANSNGSVLESDVVKTK